MSDPEEKKTWQKVLILAYLLCGLFLPLYNLVVNLVKLTNNQCFVQLFGLLSSHSWSTVTISKGGHLSLVGCVHLCSLRRRLN